MNLRLTFLLTLLLLTLSGCGRTISDGQAQALSNAQAGTDALADRLTAEHAAGKPVEHELALAYGASGFMAAATANVDPALPPPRHNAKELAGSPTVAADYQKEGTDAKANPPPGTDWLQLGAIGTTLLATVGLGLRITRNVPGIAGTISGLLSMAIEHFAPNDYKEKEDKTKRALAFAVQFGHAASSIASQDPRLAGMIDRVKAQAGVVADKIGVAPIISSVLQETKVANPMLSSVEVSSVKLPNQQ